MDPINPGYDPAFNINSPYQEIFVEPLYRGPTKQDLEIPPFSGNQINYKKLIYEFLPKQSDIGHILKTN